MKQNIKHETFLEVQRLETLVDQMTVKERLVETPLDSFHGKDPHINVSVTVIKSLYVIIVPLVLAMERLVVYHFTKRGEKSLDRGHEECGTVTSPHTRSQRTRRDIVYIGAAIVGADDAVAMRQQREHKQGILEYGHILLVTECGVLLQEGTGYPIGGVVEAMAAWQHDSAHSFSFREPLPRLVLIITTLTHRTKMQKRRIVGEGGKVVP